MRPGPPVQPSHRRPPRRQHPHQQHQQLHRERDRPRPRDNGGSPRALLVLLLLASSPLVLVRAEPPGLPAVKWQHALSQRQNQAKAAATQPRQPHNLTIGYLTAIKGGLKDRQGLAISGALSMALDEVRFLLRFLFVQSLRL